MVKKVFILFLLFSMLFIDARLIETKNKTIFNGLTKNNMVVVKFSAQWCGPCRAIRPVFEKLSNVAEYKDITFLEIDIDEAEELIEPFNIRSVPTFIFLNNGSQIAKLVGADESQLKRNLDQLLLVKKSKS